MAISPDYNTALPLVVADVDKATLRAWMAAIEAAANTVRAQLASAKTLYARTDGSDSNDGSANDSAHAYATIQAAANSAINRYDLNSNYVTVKLGNAGTYAGLFLFSDVVGAGGLIIEGDTSAPQNYIIQGGADDAIRVDNAQVGVKGVELRSTSQSCLMATGLGKIDVVGAIRFGTCAFARVNCTLGGFVHIAADYTVAGNALAHFSISSGGIVRDDASTIAASGTPTTTIWAGVSSRGVLMAAGPTGTGATFSGTWSGTTYKFSLDTGGTIFTNNLGLSYFPGTAAGVSDGTGVYDAAFSYGRRGTDIASASPLVLSGVQGDFVEVTGTTGFAAVTMPVGWEIRVRFAGVLTMTHGSTLVLPTAANITTAAGDYATFRCYSTGVVHVVSYQRADGTPLAGGSSVASAPRNILGRNGGLEVWQRGAGSSASIAVAASTTAYTADGFYLATGANQASTVSAQAGITNGSQLCARVQRNSGQTGTGTMRWAIPLTLDELVRMRGGKVVASFSARAGANWSPASGTLSYALYVGTGAAAKRNGSAYTSETTVVSGSVNLTPGGSVQQVISSLSASAVPSNATQAELQWSWTPSGTASANDYFEIDDVQIEVCTVAPSPAVFDRRSFVAELLECLAHYRKSFPYGTAPADGVFAHRLAGFAPSTTEINVGKFEFNPPMRATPTVTFFRSSQGAAANKWAYFGGSYVDASATIVGDSAPDATGFAVQLTVSGVTQFAAYIVKGNYVADAGI